MNWRILVLLGLLIVVLMGLTMLMYDQTHVAPAQPVPGKSETAAPSPAKPAPPKRCGHSSLFTLFVPPRFRDLAAIKSVGGVS